MFKDSSEAFSVFLEDFQVMFAAVDCHAAMLRDSSEAIHSNVGSGVRCDFDFTADNFFCCLECERNHNLLHLFLNLSDLCFKKSNLLIPFLESCFEAFFF